MHQNEQGYFDGAADGYSPREGANYIGISDHILHKQRSYSPREGANCICVPMPKANSLTSYSPREGANCISSVSNSSSLFSDSYSPREGANCIAIYDTFKIQEVELQSP